MRSQQLKCWGFFFQILSWCWLGMMAMELIRKVPPKPKRKRSKNKGILNEKCMESLTDCAWMKARIHFL